MDEKNKKYDVSIIIPTYNVESYIKECLDSVAAQTYCGAMECVIVDDCGKDGSIEIAKEFIANYYGDIDFRIIHRKKNGGLSAARNSGIEEVSGDYIFFLDVVSKFYCRSNEYCRKLSFCRCYSRNDDTDGWW